MKTLWRPLLLHDQLALPLPRVLLLPPALPLLFLQLPKFLPPLLLLSPLLPLSLLLLRHPQYRLLVLPQERTPPLPRPALLQTRFAPRFSPEVSG